MKWLGSPGGPGHPRAKRGGCPGVKRGRGWSRCNDSILTRAANANSIHSPSAPEESPAGSSVKPRALHLPVFKLPCPNLFSLTTGCLKCSQWMRARTPTHPLPWCLSPTSLYMVLMSEASVPAGWQVREIKDDLQNR